MLASRFQPTDRNTVAVLHSERLRRRVELMELMELIAGTRQAIAQSQALLVQADAILANEKYRSCNPFWTAGDLS
jgi:ABC-type lipoprotein export system ATPase subunit